MKKTISFLFLGISMMLIASCKKNNITYTFSGQVTTSETGSGLSGVDINVYQVIFSSSAANSNFQFAGSTITDASGNYTVTIDREKVIDFKLNMDKDGYFKKDFIIPSSDVTTDEENIWNHEMDPESWVVFNITNGTPVVDDQLTFVKYNFREDCQDCGTNEYLYFEGEVDTTLKYRTTGGVYARFSYKDELSSTIVFDSVLTVPSDTVFYDIIY